MPERKDGKARAKPKRRPIFVVLQVLDNDGVAVEFDKNRVSMVLGSNDTEKVLDAMEELPHAFYKKVSLET